MFNFFISVSGDIVHVLVYGHVHGTGTVAELKKTGEHWSLRVRCEPELLAQMRFKGSIACDGISLTIAEISPSSFRVFVIPTTMANTTLSNSRRGDLVNLELDMFEQPPGAAPGRRQDDADPISFDTLRDAGFVS